MINKYPYTDFNEYNMDWIIKTVKDLSVQWAETHQEWQDVQSEWTNYKNYIDNYFAQLDLSQEVSDKIDQMAADGYFSDLFNTLFRSDIITEAGTVTSSWIADNLLQETGYVIDSSLTVANAAADAKATGNKIQSTIDLVTGDTLTFTGTANSTVKFDYHLIKGYRYRYTNTTGANVSVTLYDGGTTQSISASLGNNLSVEFTPNADYTQIGGYFNNSGDCILTIIGEEEKLADAKEELKHDIVNLDSGIMDIGLFSEFIHGNIYQGNINRSMLYRVSSVSIIEFDQDVTIDVDAANGYTFKLNLFDSSDVYQSEIAFRTTPYTIAAHTRFRICIANSPEDTTSVADINTFVNSVTFKSNIGELIDAVEFIGTVVIPQSVLDENFSIEQNGITGGFDFVTSKQVRTSAFYYLPEGSCIVFKPTPFQKVISVYYYTYPDTNYYTSNVDGKTINANVEDTMITSHAGYIKFCVAKGSNDDITPAEIQDTVFYVASDAGMYRDLTSFQLYGVSPSMNIVDLDTKLSAFAALTNGNESDSYLFFTDPHCMGTNGTFSRITMANMLTIIEQYFTHSPCKHIVCGGDWLNMGDTKAEAKMKLGYVTGLMNKVYNRYHQIVGNHDTNNAGVDVLNSTEMAPVYGDYETQKTYYYFDSVNTRYFVLDTGRDDVDTLTQYRLNQLKWLCQELITADKPHIVLMYHTFYINLGLNTNICAMATKAGDIITAYNGRSSITIDGQTFDFSGCTNKIEYTIVGHSHVDFTATSGSRPVIGTVNCSANNNYAFDLVYVDYTAKKFYTIRIGDGSDKEISLA